MTTPTGEKTIRAAIVDDHGIVRQGLRALLTRPGIEVVGEAESGNAAIQLAETLHPDVMLLDIRMKDGDGLQSLPNIKAVSPQTSVIILTTYANPAYLARAISGGAAGYLSKETDPDQIVRAVRAAAAGDDLIDRTLLLAALSHATSDSTPPPTDLDGSDVTIEPLSERESDVLRLMVQGFSNSVIAETLTISLPTVKTHVQHILQKLHVSDRTQAALLAMRLKLVE
ncbi:MAG: response regulator transcription factor [Anaerolineae bacterium]|uniref:response regulator transcription factor n=1 Tax=Candidatus Flexifilum breve TaxID=3140694 RepID=UPI001AC20B7B|nr:response regulator transcription factor [Chloroflexota bacterium]MBN8634781.1 response regulator transcription factor [Anaerolineae bacterium]